VIFILTDRDFTKGAYIVIVNCYITPLGVLFATIWTSSKTWEDENAPTEKFSAGFTQSVIRFRAKASTRMNPTETYTLETLPTSRGQTIPGRKTWNENTEDSSERGKSLPLEEGVIKIHRVAETYVH
jgi:hypothetical protein